ncbi:putative type IX sorting system protein PorV2 [Aureivirga marina]|uniref:putative type IX sorting system protein PorV2 n=1 Tax=Aureivirga marina TaxID=1182451 RepID=UPI0018CA4161|nr:PorV/PorQ family protein [Aureivirga marina]
MKKLILFLTLILCQFAFSQTARKYSNEFLNIGVDAAAFGMGKAVTASSNDVNSGYWNPAGLTGVKGYQGSLMHAEYFAGIAKYDYAAFAMPLENNAFFGVSLIRFGVDDILDTTELIDKDGNIDYERINLFSAADYAFNLSFAKKLSIENLSVGANAKIVRRTIGDFANSWGFGLDVAAQYSYKKWQFGLMLRDITTTFNAWNIDEDEFEKIKNAIPGQNQELPETTELTLPKMQIGIARSFELNQDFDLLTELDLNVRFAETNDIISSSFASIEPAFGFQASYKQMVFLRGGVNNIQNTLEPDNTESVSVQPNFGVGFRYKGIFIDYALSNIGSVGNALYSNVFSLKFDLSYFK